MVAVKQVAIENVENCEDIIGTQKYRKCQMALSCQGFDWLRANGSASVNRDQLQAQFRPRFV